MKKNKPPKPKPIKNVLGKDIFFNADKTDEPRALQTALEVARYRDDYYMLDMFIGMVSSIGTINKKTKRVTKESNFTYTENRLINEYAFGKSEIWFEY